MLIGCGFINKFLLNVFRGIKKNIDNKRVNDTFFRSNDMNETNLMISYKFSWTFMKFLLTKPKSYLQSEI